MQIHLGIWGVFDLINPGWCLTSAVGTRRMGGSGMLFQRISGSLKLYPVADNAHHLKWQEWRAAHPHGVTFPRMHNQITATI